MRLEFAPPFIVVAGTLMCLPVLGSLGSNTY
eukprot:COSAG06_NODE_28702_length_569_cov_3.727660_1_plen_30_part_01